MKIFTDVVKKTVKLPTGQEVKRSARFTLNLPENDEEMVELLDGSAYLWASHGLLKQAAILASNKLLGAAGDKKLKKSLRQFKESLRTLTEVMDMEQAEAVEVLLMKPQFGTVKQHFDAVASGETEIEVDFSSGVSYPRWFGAKFDDKGNLIEFSPNYGEEAEEEEEEEDEEEEK